MSLVRRSVFVITIFRVPRISRQPVDDINNYSIFNHPTEVNAFVVR